MKIKFDEEFTGLHKGTTLISIGCVAENGKNFYAEFTDYDKSQVGDWVQNNVINNLCLRNDRHTSGNRICGNKREVASALKEWLSSFGELIEFVSDVCHYDFVLLIDLLAPTALELPSYISPTCHDINQDIARYLGISENAAFDLSREELVERLYGGNPVAGNKHNSLYDAMIIDLISKKLM